MKSIDCLMENGQLKQALFTATESLLMSKARLETITPIYEDVSAFVLNIHQPVVANNALNRRASDNVGRPITSINELYRASDEVAKAIYDDIKQSLAIKGVTTSNPNHCAFAVAQSDVRDAERELIDAMFPYTGISSNMLCNLEKRHQFIELTLRCLVPLAEDAGQHFNKSAA